MIVVRIVPSMRISLPVFFIFYDEKPGGDVGLCYGLMRNVTKRLDPEFRSSSFDGSEVTADQSCRFGHAHIWA